MNYTFSLFKPACSPFLYPQYRTYSALRKEHDAQIVQIAMEAGLHISPEQWSALLYGDDEHKSHMQSIIDKVGFVP